MDDDTRQQRQAVWTRHWATGAAHSCAGTYADTYGGAIADFWRGVHADTAPGTVTVSHPVRGIASRPAKRSRDHACGARPEALRPCILAPSQTIANASDPTPFETGSTTVSVMAAASIERSVTGKARRVVDKRPKVVHEQPVGAI